MERKVALITGITGQDGSYLAEFLNEKGYDVHGLLRRSSSFNTGRIEHLYLDEWVRDMKQQRPIKLHWADMTDSSSLIRIIGEIKPTEIYNLAAQSHVKVSFEVPEYTADVDAKNNFFTPQFLILSRTLYVVEKVFLNSIVGSVALFCISEFAAK